MSFINRSLLVGGPAKCTFNGQVFYHKEDVLVPITAKTFEVEIEGQATPDPRLDFWEIPFELVPDGRWTNALIAVLFPYLNTTKGAFLFSNTDVPFQFDSNDGGVLIAKSVIVVKMPDIVFDATKTLVTSLGIRGLRANNTVATDASSLYSYTASGSSYADGSFTGMGLIPTQAYTATWGAIGGFSSMYTQDGFKLAWRLALDWVRVQDAGEWQARFRNLGATVTCRPVGPTALQIVNALIAQSTGAKLQGGRMADNANQLTIVGADGTTYLTAPLASLNVGKLGEGVKVLRGEEIMFDIIRPNPSAGAQVALCTLGAAS